MTTPLCTLCGRSPASYVCQSCGRTVCGNCFDPSLWFCVDCRAKASQPRAQEPRLAPSLPVANWLFIIAFVVIFIGLMVMAFSALTSSGSVGGGAVILIGPIPIILGTGPYSTVLVGIAAALTLFSIVAFLLLRRRR